MKKAVLLIGFGGPSGMDEVRPFLASVLEGRPVPPSRIDEVAAHYTAFGGISPYNREVEKQRRALEAWLKKKDAPVPVFAAYRHSRPSFAELFETLKACGVQEAVAFILAPFRSEASFERYVQRLEKARAQAGCGSLVVRYTSPFDEDTLFLEAQAARVKKVTEEAPAGKMFYLFACHSIPVEMSDESGYAAQYLRSAEAIAKKLGLPKESWAAAYQSRSGNPREPWLGPDVKEIILSIPEDFSAIVIIPVGFLCENIEILYDLDTDARKTAEEKKLAYRRASTVSDDPLFIGLMGKRCLETL